jgi:hypothetical protein
VSDFRTLLAQLKEARARTIACAFNTFLDTQVGITAGSRERASDSHNALRDFLRGVAEDDDTFPRILRYADSDFISGSFARQVKIWPLDDVDLMFPLDGTGMVYSRGGWRLPYTPLSDGVLDVNPLALNCGRWWDGQYLSSRKLINGFAEVLRDHYPTTTRVRRGGEAVTVTLANDLGFDVVPCFSMKPDNPYEQPFYLIPDGKDGWIHTNPRLDKQMSDRLHAANNRTLRRGVKLFKWWVEEFIGGRVASYYAELAIMRAFEWRNSQGRVISSVSMAALVAFRAVRDAINAGNQQPLLQGAPHVEQGDLTQRDMQWLDQDVDNCNSAVLAEQADRIEDAFACWRKVFGNKFPSA